MVGKLTKIPTDKKKFVIILILGVVIISIIGFIYSFIVIYQGVKNACTSSTTEYNLPCNQALIETIKDEKTTYREKNTAIWALGQMARDESLAFLSELNSSLPNQERCNYDSTLCKYEVEKAVKWINQGNVTFWMYSKF